MNVKKEQNDIFYYGFIFSIKKYQAILKVVIILDVA